MNILQEFKNIRPLKKELKRFGITLGSALALLGILGYREGYYSYLLILSAVSLMLGLFMPNLLMPLHKIMTVVIKTVGFLITSIVLVILFYLVVTPVGLISKLCGKAALDLKFPGEMDSYWLRKEPAESKRRDCERQF